MIFNSFITQVGMIVLSIGILLLYIRPDFAEIGIIQNAIVEYNTELTKINSTNERLSFLVSKVNSISSADSKALLTYMPDKIDDVAITRDIFTIAEVSEVYVDTIGYEGIKKATAGDTSFNENKPIPHSFIVTVSGTYEEVKTFLSNIEQNNYPLEIYSLDITSSEAGLIEADMNIVTYSHK